MMWVATSCGIVYTRFSGGISAWTRGETRPGGELGGGELPGRGSGGGGIVGTGGTRSAAQDEGRLAGSGSGVTSIAYTPGSISGDGGGARVPSRGTYDCCRWSSSVRALVSINAELRPPVRRRSAKRVTSSWSTQDSSSFTSTTTSLKLDPSSTSITTTVVSRFTLGLL